MKLYRDIILVKKDNEIHGTGKAVNSNLMFIGYLDWNIWVGPLDCLQNEDALAEHGSYTGNFDGSSKWFWHRELAVFNITLFLRNLTLSEQ